MPNYRTSVIVNGKTYLTLQDILPTTEKQMDILFIAKTPALKKRESRTLFSGEARSDVLE